MSFLEEFSKISWDQVSQVISQASASSVEKILGGQSSKSVWDFAQLISPAARGYLPEMVQLSRAKTRQRFGKTMQIFAPLYLSNECKNSCTYCGYSVSNKIPRITLSADQILREAKILAQKGIQHVVLLTGEAPGVVDIKYFQMALEVVKKIFSYIAIEVQPLETNEYATLIRLGLNGVIVYQETYHKMNYRKYHTFGKKSRFGYRLDTPDRIGQAGVEKIGLGSLLGLSDWRVDSFFVAMHFLYLRERYWRSEYSISFPRLRAAEGVVLPMDLVGEEELVQLICAWRLFDADVDLVLSTRESQVLRDRMVGVGITSMSAGSKTSPGGYGCVEEEEELQQFSIEDMRSCDQVSSMLRVCGYEPVMKNW